MEKHTINAESLDKILSGSKKVSLIDVRRKVDYDASPPKKHQVPCGVILKRSTTGPVNCQQASKQTFTASRADL